AKTLRSMLHSRIEYPKERVEDPPTDLNEDRGKVVSVEAIESVRRRRQEVGCKASAVAYGQYDSEIRQKQRKKQEEAFLHEALRLAIFHSGEK
ncbi:hypothetical protein N8194_01815, partial [Akkermansiaceae bacterium]|nr:hypothetical protein [Akkermansiaceae bacterium]